MAEGAGTIILEELEHAKSRGAKIYGEIIGFGMSADAYHMTAPPETAEGAILAMKNALSDAAVAAEMASAGAYSAFYNIKINLREINDSNYKITINKKTSNILKKIDNNLIDIRKYINKQI